MTPNIELMILFLLLGVILYVAFYRYHHDILNPIGLFTLVWFSSIGIANLMLSRLQNPWDVSMWLVVLGSGFAFTVGGVSYTLLQKRAPKVTRIFQNHTGYSARNLKMLIIFLFVLSVCAYVFEVHAFGGIPLFMGSKRVWAYMNFGVRFVHYLTVSAVIVCLLIYLHFKVHKPRRKLFFRALFLVSAFILISILATGHLIILLSGIFTLKNYLTNKRMSLKHVGCLIIISIVTLALVSGLIRSSSHNLSYIAKISDPRIKIPSWLSFSFLPYMYVGASFENLRLSICERAKFYYGAKTLFPLWAFSLTKKYFDFKTYTTGAFNVGTYLEAYYADFGLSGVLLMPFILGLILTRFYYSLRFRPTVLKTLIYSLCVYGILITFFANWFNKPLMVFFLVLLTVTDVFCKRKKKLLGKTTVVREDSL